MAADLIDRRDDRQPGFPPALMRAVADLAARRDTPVYVVGGTVRDWLRDMTPRDLDLAVADQALEFARDLARQWGGTFVLLAEGEETARVVRQGVIVDIAGFRQGARDIREDLLLRDFTVNSLAVPFAGDLPRPADELGVIDPAGGLADLADGVIRALSSRSFTDDPLRLLRAFRFSAETGWPLADQTLEWISAHADLLAGVAGERVSAELDSLLISGRAFAALGLMKKTGVLAVILPELLLGDGVLQPASHHLDVLGHNLEALRRMEEIVARPHHFYPGQGNDLARYLTPELKRVQLCWAALCHDLGKPAAFRRQGERITFYNHDRLGGELLDAIAARLRWSRRRHEGVTRLVGLHMWPFHLCNVRRKETLSPRACLKLYKAVGADLPGLFLLAMADSLAGRGPGRPAAMEAELAALFEQVLEVCRTRVEPALAGPPLVTGRDLIDAGLTPGPRFKEILGEVEKARVDGVIENRDQALDWLRHFLSSL